MSWKSRYSFGTLTGSFPFDTLIAHCYATLIWLIWMYTVSSWLRQWSRAILWAWYDSSPIFAHSGVQSVQVLIGPPLIVFFFQSMSGFHSWSVTIHPTFFLDLPLVPWPYPSQTSCQCSRTNHPLYSLMLHHPTSWASDHSLWIHPLWRTFLLARTHLIPCLQNPCQSPLSWSPLSSPSSPSLGTSTVISIRPWRSSSSTWCRTQYPGPWTTWTVLCQTRHH